MDRLGVLAEFKEERRDACVALDVSDEAAKDVTELIVMEMDRCREKIPTVSFFFVDFEEDAFGKIRMTSNLISTEDAPNIVNVSAKVLSYLSWRYSHVEIYSSTDDVSEACFNGYETYKDHTRRWHFEYIF